MRLKTRYKNLAAAADVPGALDVEVATDSASAAASTPPHDDGTASSRLREQLELMRERISAPPPPSDVDSAVEAAKQAAAVSLDRHATPDPEPDDDSDASEQAAGLPPLAIQWLRNNPEYLQDETKNAALQNLHWELVAEGYEGYGPEYFAEVDKRLHGSPRNSSGHDEIAAAERQLEAAERDRDRLMQWNKDFDGAVEEVQKSPADRAIEAARAARNSNPAVNAKPRRTIPPVSAPPSREVPTSNGARTGTRITLSPRQKEAAAIAGISEVQYAANLLRLNEEKANGRYGGDP
jgi:hypothetical protein